MDFRITFIPKNHPNGEPLVVMKLDHYPDLIIRYRWPAIVIIVLTMLATSAGIGFIGVTNDYRSLFDKDNPQVALLDELENIYGKSESSIIAIEPQSQTVFDPDVLSAIETLTDTAWQVPYSTRVDSLTNYLYSWAIGDDLIVEELVIDALSLSDDEVQRVEDIALTDNDVFGRLVSRDGRVAGLVINFSLPEGNSDAAVFEITDYLTGMLDEARAENPDINYYLTGEVPLNRAFSDATNDDLQTLIPIVLLVIAVLSTILLRSFMAMAALMAVVIFSVNMVMGVAGWLGVVFNPANAGVPIIVMTVAVAHSVHIVETVLARLAQGVDRKEAVKDALRSNMWPIFLTSVTTMIGFLSLNASDSPPFRVLGNLVAFGVFWTFVFSLTLLPAVVSLLPLRSKKRRSISAEWFDRFSLFVIAKRKILLIITSLITIFLASGILQLELTDNWLKYFDKRYQFREDTDFVTDNLTGILTFEYSLNSGSENGVSNPDYLQKVENFAEWFRQQPEVLHVQSFTDIMKRLNKNMNADDPEYFRLPDSSELAAQYLLLYELSLPFGRDLNNRIDVGKSSTRLTVSLDTLTASQQQDLDTRAQSWLNANAPDMVTEASGVTIVFAHLSQRNIKSMLSGTIIAMAIISLILIVVFRSLRIGLISLIPNFIPAALSLGLWGYLVGRVGLAGSVMTAFAFGIIVDDTIHFLTSYLKARRDDKSPADAIRATFQHVGHALWTTSLVLASGFLVFATSGFEVSWVLGVLVMLTIWFAFLADFLLLPPLLMALDRKKP